VGIFAYHVDRADPADPFALLSPQEVLYLSFVQRVVWDIWSHPNGLLPDAVLFQLSP
jgi:hypothetical protein